MSRDGEFESGHEPGVHFIPTPPQFSSMTLLDGPKGGGAAILINKSINLKIMKALTNHFFFFFLHLYFDNHISMPALSLSLNLPFNDGDCHCLQ